MQLHSAFVVKVQFVQFLSQNIHRVWPLSPVAFIYKAVLWNTMLTVCSPMLAVSTEPCGAANLPLEQYF